MRFLPKTRQVELENANPEKIIRAFPGTYFYRSGNDLFYLIKNNQYQRIDVRKRSFATKYYNELWYPSITNKYIVFEKAHELWIKTGSGFNAKGWKFVSSKSINLTTATPTANIYYVDGGNASGAGPVYGDVILDGGTAASVF
jgi:hypothetical protein